jgi:hypothetical protein
MRTTVDINDVLLKEAWQLVKPKSKRELIEHSLEELIRREHLKRLADRLGRTPMVSRGELLRIRRRG